MEAPDNTLIILSYAPTEGDISDVALSINWSGTLDDYVQRYVRKMYRPNSSPTLAHTLQHSDLISNMTMESFPHRGLIHLYQTRQGAGIFSTKYKVLYRVFCISLASLPSYCEQAILRYKPTAPLADGHIIPLYEREITDNLVIQLFMWGVPTFTHGTRADVLANVVRAPDKKTAVLYDESEERGWYDRLMWCCRENRPIMRKAIIVPVKDHAKHNE